MLPCTAMRNRWDLFCRVIDNHGDIGVCWRLARQLAGEHGLAVRLWVDDLSALVPLLPRTDPARESQVIDGVELRHWRPDFLDTPVADVVIETFACALPGNYLAAIQHSPAPPLWINLEYLSAEAWVEDCHALASPHPALGLNKYFFFPGFSSRTGGLLREQGLFAERDIFEATRAERGEGLEISLFCYDNAPVGPLLEAWAAGQRPIRCRVPPGKPLAAVRAHWGGPGPWERGSLQVEPIPFLPQIEYDRLLWSCDVNFVRGEDSFVRAQWAARPFVWQIYAQDEEAHFDKLGAFLERYTAALPTAASGAARDLFAAWNGRGEIGPAWAAFESALPLLDSHARPWAESLASHGDLAGNLVNFAAARL